MIYKTTTASSSCIVWKSTRTDVDHPDDEASGDIRFCENSLDVKDTKT